MRVEEEWAEGSHYAVCDTGYLMSPDKCQTCGDPGIFYFESEKFDATSGSLLYSTQRAPGVGITGGGSAVGISPLTANSLPGGALAGNGWCAVEYTPGALDCEWKFRHENQLGSLIGVTNLDGNRIAEIDYGEYGQTYPKHILWDGPVDVANTQGVAATITRVYTYFGFGIPLDVVNGLVRCVHPGIDNHVSFGTVLNVDYDAGLMQSYMDVEDLEGRVLNAIKEYGCDLTVLGNYGNVAPGSEPVNSAPASQVTHILLIPGVFFPEDVLGAVLRATNSESAATAVVTDVDPNGAFIKFDDPNGAVADIINGDGGQFLIWDNRLGAEIGYPTTGGTWTGVETETLPDLSMRTILHAGGEDFREFMVGWQVQIDAAVPVYLDIVTTTGDGICVSGDVSALVTAEETEFCIIHPVGVNPQNGATQTNPCQPESRYLWGGGYYLPPIVGFEMDHDGVFGIHGQQPGNNKSGQHHMWNRRFDINMGRWTTPDPAMSHLNLLDVVAGRVLSATDPLGLSGWEQIDELIEEKDCLSDTEKDLVKQLAAAGWTFIDGDVEGTSTDAKGSGVRSQDNQFRIDYNKKEVELDYAYNSTGCVQLRIALGFISRDLKKAGTASDLFRKKHGGEDDTFDVVEQIEKAADGASNLRDRLDEVEEALKKGGKALPDDLGKLRDGAGKIADAKKLYDVGKDCLKFGEMLQGVKDGKCKWPNPDKSPADSIHTITLHCIECMIHMANGIEGLSGIDRRMAESACKDLQKKYGSK